MSLLGGGLTGDIWSTGAFSFESPLKDLLDSGSYTVEQLLAEDELLQEIRGVHPKLIEFFSKASSITKLIEYIIQEPPEKPTNGSEAAPLAGAQWLMHQIGEAMNDKKKNPETDHEMRYIRFPFMACEVICCEVPAIIDQLVDGEVEGGSAQHIVMAEDDVEVVESRPKRLLDLLFSLLYRTTRLDDYRAGYFEKILRVLFKKRPDDMSAYINSGGGLGDQASLISAMLRHLYSHSIMQIAQRLLLPQRPTPKKEEKEEEEDGDDDDILPAADDAAGEIKSDWSKSTVALDILLGCLIGPDEPPESEAESERRLDLSLNASEVLLTIIQNSMLSSPTMLSLTSSKTLERLIRSATELRPYDNDFFSPHESLLTSSMSVLESLILQLGGYGAVGTMQLLPEDAEVLAIRDGVPEPLIADLTSLVEHLPLLLDSMSNLLQHPSTEEWRTPTQYMVDKGEAQPMLGCSRLKIVRVLESLVLLGDIDVDQRLIDSDCLEVCLNLFWDFQWCSMLHQSVANLLVHVLEGQNARVDMQEYFLIRCNLLVRLMDSFMDADPSRINNHSDNVVVNMKDVSVEDVVPLGSEKGSNDEPLPISEDDVDAALEQQEEKAMKEKGTNVELVSTEAVQYESRDTSVAGFGAPPQSFRFGYMGHVIIICQALVHACTALDDDDETKQTTEGQQSADGQHQLDRIFEASDAKATVSLADTESKDGTEDLEKEPLFLAEMVACHPLSDKWNEFVATTLATETSIQSTPLGGYSMHAAGGDPLHAHRPGLTDEADMGLGLEPPRGMLGGGDVIDMDDNDLDIAASMMVGLSLSGDASPDGEDDNSGNSGDSERSYNSGETNNQGGYLFDDPLGKNGGLGIELGKLTQYSSDKDSGKPSGQPGDEESDDSSDHSSSSEEEERQGSDSDVPVMDLFAGNFDYGDSSNPEGEPSAPGWSDFANFDDAFTGAPADASPTDDDFGAFESASGGEDEFGPFASGSGSTDEAENPADLDDFFGKGDHAALLESSPEKQEPPQPVTVDQTPIVVEEPIQTPETVDSSPVDPAEEGTDPEVPAPSDDKKLPAEQTADPVVDVVEPGTETSSSSRDDPLLD